MVNILWCCFLLYFCQHYILIKIIGNTLLKAMYNSLQKALYRLTIYMTRLTMHLNKLSSIFCGKLWVWMKTHANGCSSRSIVLLTLCVSYCTSGDDTFMQNPLQKLNSAKYVLETTWGWMSQISISSPSLLCPDALWGTSK